MYLIKFTIKIWRERRDQNLRPLFIPYRLRYVTSKMPQCKIAALYIVAWLPHECLQLRNQYTEQLVIHLRNCHFSGMAKTYLDASIFLASAPFVLKPLPLCLFCYFFSVVLPSGHLLFQGLVGPKPNCYRSPRWFFNYYLLLPDFWCKIQI